MNYHKTFSRFFLILAVLSLAYYGVCIIYAWAGVSWLWIWPAFSAFCFLRHAILQMEMKDRLHIPRALRMLYRLLAIFAIVIFTLVEKSIITDMKTEPEEGLDYIIVLGAAVRGNEPTTPLLLRIETAEEYLKNNNKTWIIASGGQGAGESITEAECIKKYLIQSGIPEHKIILENSSGNTEANIRNSMEIIGNPEIRVGIVTNGFHIYRSLMIANQLGYRNVCGIPAPTLMPLGIHYVVREFFGVAEIWLKTIL